MNTLEKIELLNNNAKFNWEIRFHGKHYDILYPDSLITPDYEDYETLNEALNAVINDLK